MTAAKFDIVPIESVEIELVLEVLTAVFGPRSLAWYRWKHIDNPSGPSVGWVAVDNSGIIGVRLFQRWNLVAGTEAVQALRPVDTMTLPRARRRGVFRALLHTALDELCSDDENALIFNTPNENSREGYAKSGWTLLPAIRHGYRLTTPGTRHGSKLSVAAIVNPYREDPGSLATLKSSEYLAWRYDARSGHSYSAASGGDSDNPASIIYRVDACRRVRRMVLLEVHGSGLSLRTLVTATARSEGAVATLLAFGMGTRSAVKPHFVRGSSILAVRPLTRVEPNPLRLESWSLSLGDLEDVL